MSKFSIVLALLTAALAPFAPARSTQKPLAFEVVSIHPSKPGSRNMMWSATTPDGYRATSQSMLTTIRIAYFPQESAYWSKDDVSGAPAWLSDPFDINAKVSDADLAEWQKQGSAPDKKPMLSEMLQTLLADRCHLVTHMVPRPLSGWSLSLGKHAPLLTESKPSETLPKGVRLPGGGIMVPYQSGDKPRLTIYGGTMADLAQALSMFSRSPVQDHTGLPGRYDFVLNWVSNPDSKVPQGFLDPNDPDPLSRWDIDALGLHAVPIKIPGNTLVIDHIERPSEN
jgi:uncharacterized protein (TIGR03435 family)